MLIRQGRSVFFGVNYYGGAYTGQAGNTLKGGGLARNYGGFSARFSAYPNGTLAPNSFILPIKSGSISSYKNAEGAISGAAPLIPARNLEASSTMSIVVTDAQLDQIVSAVASGTLTMQKLDAILAGAAALSANGTLQITSSASAGAIFSVTADASGNLSVSANLTALAFMEAEAGGPTPLSPEGLAGAVWGSVATANNQSGTMGEKLNDAGGAGNPWSAELSSNNTDGTFGGFVQKLLTVAKFLGLK